MTDFADDATMIRDSEPYREFEDGRIRVYGYTYDTRRSPRSPPWPATAGSPRRALMADNHLGYSMPIGGVAGYRDMVSPSGVGYDIGCGVMAVRTPLHIDDVRDGPRPAGRRDRARRISFGLGPQEPDPRRVTSCSTRPIWREVPELTQTVTGRKVDVVAAHAGRAAARHRRLAATTTSTCWSSRRTGRCGSPATSAAAASATASRPGS